MSDGEHSQPHSDRLDPVTKADLQPTPDMANTLDAMTITQLLVERGITAGIELRGDGGSASVVNRIAGQESRRKYDVGDTMAHGGMGAILAARDLSVRRTVAMKVMLKGKQASEQDLARFVHEAQVTGQMEHPNIVPVHELAVDGTGNPFYTMKLIQGTTLKDVLDGIKENQRDVLDAYPLVRLLNIFLRVCDAIAFAHSRGVVHRDLKPANIMVGDYGEVLVLDWGLAKVLCMEEVDAAASGPGDGRAREPSGTSSGNVGQRESTARLAGPTPGPDHAQQPHIDTVRQDEDSNVLVTMDGQVVGTPHFMAPEQAVGNLDAIDTRTDIYALGAILYSLLTLHPPVAGESVRQVLLNVVQGEITPPAALGASISRSHGTQSTFFPHCSGGRIPDSLSAVSMKALARESGNRYRTVQLLQGDVEAYLHGFATEAEQASLWRQLGLLVGRHKAVFVVVAGALLVLALVVAGFVQGLSSRNRLLSAALAAAEENLAKFQSERKAKIEVSVGSAPEFVIKARKMMDLKRWGEARAAATEATELDGGSAEAWYLRGTLELADRDCAAALESLAQVGKLDAAPALRRQTERCSQLAAQFQDQLVRNESLDSGKLTYALAQALQEANEPLLAGRLFQESGKVLAADLQTLTAIDRLLSTNPGLTKKDVDCRIDDRGQIAMYFTRNAQMLTDISALAGLPVTNLTLTKTQVRDISALAGMHLQQLGLSWSPVADISVLAGMPLTLLELQHTHVTDIRALEGMRLAKLKLSSRVTDIAVLEGMPMTVLSVHNVTNPSVIEGMPLVMLQMFGTQIEDTRLLKGMQLRSLRIQDSPVADVGELRGMPLMTVSFHRLPLSDLSPLSGAPLKTLGLYGCANIRDLTTIAECRELENLVLPPKCKDIEFLRNMPKLKRLSYLSENNENPAQSAAEFWREYDAEKAAQVEAK